MNISANDTKNNIVTGEFWINVTAAPPTPPPSNVTAVSTPQCRYKKFGYYNKYLPWLRETGCI